MEFRNLEIWNLEMWNLEIWKFRNLGIWKLGNSETFGKYFAKLVQIFRFQSFGPRNSKKPDVSTTWNSRIQRFSACCVATRWSLTIASFRVCFVQNFFDTQQNGPVVTRRRRTDRICQASGDSVSSFLVRSFDSCNTSLKHAVSTEEIHHAELFNNALSSRSRQNQRRPNVRSREQIFQSTFVHQISSLKRPINRNA